MEIPNLKVEVLFICINSTMLYSKCFFGGGDLCRDTRPGGVMTSSNGSPPISTLWTFASRSPKLEEKGKSLLPGKRSA